MLVPRRLRFLRRAGPPGRLVVAITLLTGCTALLAWTLSTSVDGLPSRMYPSRRGPHSGYRRHADVQDDDGGHESVVKGKRLRSVEGSADRRYYQEVVEHRYSDVVARWSSEKLPWFFSNGTEWPRPSSKLSRLPNVWPDPQSPHDDRIVAQLMYLPPGYHGNLNRTIYLILISEKNCTRPLRLGLRHPQASVGPENGHQRLGPGRALDTGAGFPLKRRPTTHHRGRMCSEIADASRRSYYRNDPMKHDLNETLNDDTTPLLMTL
ncbi:hypothetical protein MTO96_000759 [Rhipicephalus appendiculatus]